MPLLLFLLLTLQSVLLLVLTHLLLVLGVLLRGLRGHGVLLPNPPGRTLAVRGGSGGSGDDGGGRGLGRVGVLLLVALELLLLLLHGLEHLLLRHRHPGGRHLRHVTP